MSLLRWALLQLVLLRFLLAVLLAGQESEGAGVTEAFATERGLAFRFQAAHSGTGEVMKFHTPPGVASTCTSVRVGVCADLAGEPGALIGSEALLTSSLAKETSFEVPGLSSALVSGTFYWLVLLPLGGNLRLKANEVGKGTSASYIGSKSVTIAASTWPTSSGQGPAYVALLGTESATGGHVSMMV